MSRGIITLTHDQLDELVLEELKAAYRVNAIPDKIDCSDEDTWVDYEFLKSLEHVMEYYMSAEQKKAWLIEKETYK